MKNNIDLKDKYILDSNNDEIDLKEIFKYFIKKRLIIGIITMLGTLGTAVNSLFQIPIYKGGFQIILNKDNSSLSPIKENSFSAILSDVSNSNINTQVEILKSPLVLKPVFEFVKKNKSKQAEEPIKMNYESWRDSSLDVKLIQGTSVLDVEYKDEDKDLILSSLKLISEKYKSYSKRDELKKLSRGEEFLQNQILLKKKEKFEAAQNLNNYMVENNLGILALNGFYASNERSNKDLIGESKLNVTKDTLDFQEIIIQNSLLKEYEGRYYELSLKLKPESKLLSTLKEKIDYRKSILERPNRILVEFKDLQRIYKASEELLFNLEDELTILKIEKAKQVDPWELISEPQVAEIRISPHRKKQTMIGFFISLIASSIFLLVYRRIKGTLFSLSGFSKLINYNLLGVLYSNDPNLNEKKLKLLFERDIDLLNKENSFIFLGKKDKRNFHILNFLNSKKIKEISFLKLDPLSTNHQIILLFDQHNTNRKEVSTLLEYLSASKSNVLGWFYINNDSKLS